MSLDVISRFTGGPNLIPLLSRNVHVLPPFVGFGIAVARSATDVRFFHLATVFWLIP